MESKHSVVESIIRHSARIIELKMISLQLEHAIKMMHFSRDSSIFIKFIEYIKDIVNININKRINEHSNTIERYLKPLFQGMSFDGYTSDTIWHISEYDIKRGIVELSTIKHTNVTHFLFLSNYKDNKFDFQEGTLYHSSEVFSIVNNYIKEYQKSNKNKRYCSHLMNIYALAAFADNQIANQKNNKYKHTNGSSARVD